MNDPRLARSAYGWLAILAACASTHQPPAAIPVRRVAVSVTSSAICALVNERAECRGTWAGTVADVDPTSMDAFADGEPCVVDSAGTTLCFFDREGWHEVDSGLELPRLYSGNPFFIRGTEVEFVASSTGSRWGTVVPDLVDAVGQSRLVFALAGGYLRAGILNEPLEEFVECPVAFGRLTLSRSSVAMWTAGGRAVGVVEFELVAGSPLPHLIRRGERWSELPAAVRVLRGDVRGDFLCALIDTGEVYCNWEPEGFCHEDPPGDFVPIALGAAAIGLSVGPLAACAVLSDTSVVCWGANPDGRMADGIEECVSRPVPIDWI